MYTPPEVTVPATSAKPIGIKSRTATLVAVADPPSALLLKTFILKVTTSPTLPVVGVTVLVNSRSAIDRMVRFIVSDETAQLPLLTVHCKVYIPGIVPVTAVVGEVESIKPTVLGPET